MHIYLIRNQQSSYFQINNIMRKQHHDQLTIIKWFFTRFFYVSRAR